jgi:hypothetical protein
MTVEILAVLQKVLGSLLPDGFGNAAAIGAKEVVGHVGM